MLHVSTRAAKKVARYALREPGGYDFTPLVVESYRRQCSATHTLLNLGASGLRQRACQQGGMGRGRAALSVALCKGNDLLFRPNLHAFWRLVGRHPTRGAAVPHTVEV